MNKPKNQVREEFLYPRKFTYLETRTYPKGDEQPGNCEASYRV